VDRLAILGLICGKGVRFRVENTLKKLGDLIVHEGVVEVGRSSTLASFWSLMLTTARRRATRANHSATHILHEALRQILGEHVAQKGSLVASERLRFDFTHPKPLTDDELNRVEKLANEIVQDNTAVEARLSGSRRRHQLGARALFGEKYGE
jgi:alanyl-tRNA synthetase